MGTPQDTGVIAARADDARRDAAPTTARLLDPPALLSHLAQATISADELGTGRPVVLSIGLTELLAVRNWFGSQAKEHLVNRILAEVIERLPGTAAMARPDGGEEITVVLTAPTDRSAVEALASELQALATNEHRVDGRLVTVGATVGIAYGGAGIPVREVTAQADTAMYRAKVTSVAVLTFEPERPVGADERAGLADELTRAAEADQLVVHYQPIVELRSGRLVGLEALLRWSHPQRGVLSARQVLDAANDAGLVNGLTTWVLDQVQRDLLWIAPAADRPLTITINLSADNLRDPATLERVDGLVQSAAQPLTMVLDVPESCLSAAGPDVTRSLAKLHEAGALIAVDDFAGDGSTAGYLRELPIQTLKLAPSLTRGVVSNPRSSALVMGVSGICDRLGLVLAAKAVEHRAQRDALVSAGCVLGQGWLFGTSVSGREFSAALAATAGTLPQQRSAGSWVGPNMGQRR